MIELREHDGQMYTSAKELYDYLEVKKHFSQWIRDSVINAKLKYDKDFLTYKLESTGGRPMVDYLLKKNPALKVVLQSRLPKSIDLMDMLINIFEQKQTGILLDVDQVSALTDMVKAMTLVSNQKDSERKHYDFLNRPANWYNYRAELLGYSALSLRDAMIKVNKKYKNQKQALINIDPAEIIRTGVVDLLIALGRGREYALNIAEFAKVIAEKNGYHLQIWNDTKPNPLGLNIKQTKERKKLI